MSIQLDREITQDFERAARLEWLEPNGLGGWAGTTVTGAHSRRYHGLLVAATRPERRSVLLSRLDETIHLGGESFDLGCNRFPGTVAPRGFEHLASFRKDLFPVFEYEAGGVRLRKTVAAVAGENTTLVLYEVLEAPGPFVLSLRPFLAARDQHALASAQDALSLETEFSQEVLRLRPSEDEPAVFVAVPGADFQANPQWWYRFEYEQDRQRGFDFQEDLWTPGLFGRELAAGDRLGVVISTAEPRGRDAFALLEKERKRREKLLANLPEPLQGDDLARQLALAGDGFLVRRGPQQRAVMAGYPWFGERSRDAMISLPGLCLATGRFDDARKILRAAARALDGGLFPEPSVDAPLWFCVAGWKLLQATGDEDFARDVLLPAARRIVQAFQKGTRHGIRMDEDGLLLASDPDLALTWMDGRDFWNGGRPVTPRSGKPVEVQALWANALSILAELEKRCGDPAEAKRRAKEAKRAQKSFEETFWNEEAGALFDVIDPGGIQGEHRDDALRPNQVIALSLPFPLLPKAKAARVLEAVERELYTPVGLRSLAPGHPAYRPRYEGDPFERELAYHQGTVWSWLLGPYLTALVRLHGAAGRKKGLAAIEALRPRLAEAGLGSLSEIFDGDVPHAPRGCIARAWSVAEVLRAWVEDLQPAPAKPKRTAASKTRKAPAGE